IPASTTRYGESCTRLTTPGGRASSCVSPFLRFESGMKQIGHFSLPLSRTTVGCMGQNHSTSLVAPATASAGRGPLFLLRAPRVRRHRATLRESCAPLMQVDNALQARVSFEYANVCAPALLSLSRERVQSVADLLLADRDLCVVIALPLRKMFLPYRSPLFP